MECPNCTFQNAPGSPRCVRCQSSLQLAGVAVVPPRAARGAVGRARQRAVRSRRRFGEGVRGYGRSLTRPWMGELSWRALVWSVAPGVGHIRIGRRAVGFTLLAVWVGLLLGAASVLGTGRSWMLAFASISVHSLSFSLLLAPVLQRMAWQRRVVVGVAVYAALIFGLYYPVRVTATHAAHVLSVRGVLDSAVCRDGDALLYTSEWTRPERFVRGDLVVYRIEPRSTGNVVIRGGVGVDRIVGVAGDRVTFAGGALLVNGEAPPEEHLPLHGLRRLPDLDFTVGEGEYLIFPTNLRWMDGHGEALRAATIRDISRVSGERVLGRVFARAAPWLRAGRL